MHICTFRNFLLELQNPTLFPYVKTAKPYLKTKSCHVMSRMAILQISRPTTRITIVTDIFRRALISHVESRARMVLVLRRENVNRRKNLQHFGLCRIVLGMYLSMRAKCSTRSVLSLTKNNFMWRKLFTSFLCVPDKVWDCCSLSLVVSDKYSHTDCEYIKNYVCELRIKTWISKRSSQ